MKRPTPNSRFCLRPTNEIPNLFFPSPLIHADRLLRWLLGQWLHRYTHACAQHLPWPGKSTQPPTSFTFSSSPRLLSLLSLFFSFSCYSSLFFFFFVLLPLPVLLFFPLYCMILITYGTLKIYTDIIYSSTNKSIFKHIPSSPALPPSSPTGNR